MRFVNHLGLFVSLSFIFSGFSNPAHAAPEGIGLSAPESMSGLAHIAADAHKDMTGETIAVKTSPTQQALADFCSGNTSLLMYDRALTAPALASCGVQSITEIKLGDYFFDLTTPPIEFPVFLFVDRGKATESASFLTFITDEQIIGEDGVLADGGLKALSKAERDATRQTASHLPVYSPVSSSTMAADDTTTAEVQPEQPDPEPEQPSTVTLANLVQACMVEPRPATGFFVCDETVGAVGDTVEAKCITLRETGKINCEAAGPYADTLSALAARCQWPNDPVFKDRLGNPMRGKTIACN